MAIMLTGVSVPQSAPKGTLVGVLHWYGSGAPVASNFVLGHARRFGPHSTPGSLTSTLVPAVVV